MTRGGDLRYVWVALAGLSGGAAVMWIAAAYGQRRSAAAWIAAAVFLVATISAVAAARLLGTMMGTGMLIVAASFGLCFAAGSLFFRLRG